MSVTKVYLIGGAPGVGKTTLGSALAARLGITSLSIDDLMTAAQAVTTPETHPDLHIMSTVPHLEYFTDRPVERLAADAEAQHAAVWPVVERVVRKHARWGAPIVIDGWHIRPERVVALGLDGVWAGWIIASPSVLEERERGNLGWMRGSTDPDRMLANFLGRSLWFNGMIEERVIDLGMDVLRQPGDASVEDLCDAVLRASGASKPA